MKGKATAQVQSDVPYAVTQEPARARRRSSVIKLLDDVRGTAEEWKKGDPIGMKVDIAINKRLAAALTEALDAMPNPVAPRTPGLSKATPRKHTPKNEKKSTTRALKKAATHCGR